MKTTYSHLFSIILFALLPLAGCQSFRSAESLHDTKKVSNWDLRKYFGWGEVEPELPQIPTRIVSTWSDAVLHRQGKKPNRGFGGRIIFFGHEDEKPVRVEGQLIVYAFDEVNRPQHDTSPTKKYIFPAEQFVRHESKSKLGPSYSVWLPWDEVGGEQKNISLIARFEPTGGSIVLGEQTRHLLPGFAPTLLAEDEGQGIDYMATARQIRAGVIDHGSNGTLASHVVPEHTVQHASAEMEIDNRLAVDFRTDGCNDGGQGANGRSSVNRMEVTEIRLPNGSTVSRALGAKRISATQPPSDSLPPSNSPLATPQAPGQPTG